MSQRLPPSASVATPLEGRKLHAPSAARNADAIADFIQTHAPPTGKALEIASGTGQHVIAFAAACPGLIWQPSDVDPDRLRSIDSYTEDAGLENIQKAQTLDATTAGWSQHHADQDLIVLINLLHLIPTPHAQTLIIEAARALSPQGALILYGPFKREGHLISEGDARFDADLRAADPLIGYKDTLDMARWFGDAGLHATAHDMPANNLAFVARKHR